jgi:hypothetical protein
VKHRWIGLNARQPREERRSKLNRKRGDRRVGDSPFDGPRARIKIRKKRAQNPSDDRMLDIFCGGLPGLNQEQLQDGDRGMVVAFSVGEISLDNLLTYDGLRPLAGEWRRLQERRTTAAMLVGVRKGAAAGGTRDAPSFAPRLWYGAFGAVLSEAIRAGVTDLRSPAAADEIAYSAITFVDMGHIDQRPRIAPELFRQPGDLPQAEAMVEHRKPDVAQAEPLGEERTHYAVKSSVPSKPRGEQFIARRLEDDGQWFGVRVDSAAHWKATSFSETGL